MPSTISTQPKEPHEVSQLWSLIKVDLTSLKAFWMKVAWPSSGPATVVILVVDYISELTIHSLYVHPFCVKEMNTLFIVNLMQQIAHSW